MSKLLESGDLQQHISGVLQPAYAKRYQTAISTIRKCLVPLGVTMPGSDREVAGGYFIWLYLPAPLKAAEVAAQAKSEANLIIADGLIFGVYGDVRTDDLDRGVRLSFAWEEETAITEGIERLARVIGNMQTRRRDGNDQEVARAIT